MATYSFRVEVLRDTPQPQPVTTCEEYGRVTRIFVSGYQRARGHVARLTRGERRCLVVDFNGAIPLSRSIASVTWRVQNSYAAALSGARIVGREAVVDLRAQQGGRALIKCEATLDNGEAYMQMVEVRIDGAPWYEGESQPVEGPRVLTVTA